MSIESLITEYLTKGGLFNPELMNHDLASKILQDCRAELAQRDQRERELVEALHHAEEGVIKSTGRLLTRHFIDCFELLERMDSNYRAAGINTLEELWLRITGHELDWDELRTDKEANEKPVSRNAMEPKEGGR